MDQIKQAGEALRSARHHLSQAEIAEALGRSERTVRRWEVGDAEPPALIIPALREALAKKMPQPAAGSADFTFIDLFAGIGGIRMGFERHGGRCVWTSEWNDWAVKTYRQNFGEGHEINGDITKVLDPGSEVPDHDVLLAGFPCQPFSIAGVSKKNALGRPHGFECTTQGTLFFDVARIIQEKKPKAFILENVKNLVSHDGGNTFRVIREVLTKELGYHIHWKVIDGLPFVPQHRERIIVVGFLAENDFTWDALSLPATGPRLGSILHRNDGTEPVLEHDGERFFMHSKKRLNPKYTLTDHLWTYLQNYAEKHRLKGNGFGFGLVTEEDTTRTLSARYYKDGSEILVAQKRKNPRRLTPRECARLMGFPDSFHIPVSDTQAYKQFGNSVVVPVMTEVARLVKPHIMAAKNSAGSSQRYLFAA